MSKPLETRGVSNLSLGEVSNKRVGVGMSGLNYASKYEDIPDEPRSMKPEHKSSTGSNLRHLLNDVDRVSSIGF